MQFSNEEHELFEAFFNEPENTAEYLRLKHEIEDKNLEQSYDVWLYMFIK